MPSPVGHTIAGLAGFFLIHPHLKKRQKLPLLGWAIFVANSPDLDMIPGLILAGDPALFHRQATHSITAAIAAVLLTVVGLRLNKIGDRQTWGLWIALLYFSHIFLDMLVTDTIPPAGVQALWPFTSDYFISPVTIFAGFDYNNPNLSFLRTILSWNNFFTVVREIVIIAPLAYLCKRRTRAIK